MTAHDAIADLAVLTALGFGPESALMNEPKLFVDRNFLAVLMAELADELGAAGANTALFQIGFMHGMRDAARVATLDGSPEGPASHAECPPVAMQLGGREEEETPGALAFRGSWPECYEAEARLCVSGASQLARCALSAGYTSGWLSESFGADMLVVEESCCARGDDACRFRAREAASWQRDSDEEALALLECLPFDSFRDVVTRDGGPAVELEPSPNFDAQAAVVHVWGPVMILPFDDPDEALRTLEMLGREASESQVRAVVVDLRSATLDEAFGAAALESALDTIASWGAEAVLTQVSQFSEPVVHGIEAARLVIRKDLQDAIATAFQIVEAQRHPL